MSDILDIEAEELLFLHSPLNMLAMMTRFLQIRFSQGRLPWEWKEDPSLSKIFIEAEFALPKEFSTVSPSIIVTRGSTVFQRPVVGDQGSVSPNQLTRGWARKYGMAEMDIRLQCISEKHAEASIIGDIVQAAVAMSRTGLTQGLSLRDISSVVLSPTQPYIRDKEKWMANVDFRVHYEHRWLVKPSAPILDCVEFFTKESLDAADYVKTFVLKNQ